MNPENFPCPSCGGPVEPSPGKTNLPCPYCGSTVTIPEDLRLENKSLKASSSSSFQPAYTPPPPPTGDDITDVLRQVEPLATNAVKAYGFWILLRNLWRRVLPACAIILMILCLLACGTSVLLIFLYQRGG
jgi:predicted RNA-binding Zn-ribbon protein involved in translation (DUF1610 family)